MKTLIKNGRIGKAIELSFSYERKMFSKINEFTALLFLLCVVAIFLPNVVKAQVYRVALMNAEQLRALDKSKTVVILTGGILEQHGPHLPSFTDGYSNEWLAQKLAEEITERRPDLSVLMFPTIPLGHGGANEVGARFPFFGTYEVRRSTLRAIFMDLAMELGEQGFRQIFVVHGHGSPFHNLMLDQAGDFFRDTYGGKMINLRGLAPTDAQLTKLKLAPPNLNLSEAQTKEIGGMDEHAGFEETSRLMFLRSDLVDPVYKTLTPLTTNNPPEFFKTARADNWLGYLGSPRLSTANYGAILQNYRTHQDNTLALAILSGTLDERDIPRVSRLMTANKDLINALSASEKNEMDKAKRQQNWMNKNGIK